MITITNDDVIVSADELDSVIAKYLTKKTGRYVDPASVLSDAIVVHATLGKPNTKPAAWSDRCL